MPKTITTTKPIAGSRAGWLIKSEPSVFSIEDLQRDQRTAWEGVRTYQARNFMRDAMAEGDGRDARR